MDSIEYKLSPDAQLEISILKMRLENADATCVILNDEYERIVKENDELKEEVEMLNDILAEFILLGKEYEKKLNRINFYRDSKLYKARENLVEARGGQSDPESVGSRRRRIEEIAW